LHTKQKELSSCNAGTETNNHTVLSNSFDDVVPEITSGRMLEVNHPPTHASEISLEFGSLVNCGGLHSVSREYSIPLIT